MSDEERDALAEAIWQTWMAEYERTGDRSPDWEDLAEAAADVCLAELSQLRSEHEHDLLFLMGSLFELPDSPGRDYVAGLITLRLASFPSTEKADTDG